jgi:hypothetical protein
MRHGLILQIEHFEGFGGIGDLQDIAPAVGYAELDILIALAGKGFEFPLDPVKRFCESGCLPGAETGGLLDDI